MFFGRSLEEFEKRRQLLRRLSETFSEAERISRKREEYRNRVIAGCFDAMSKWHKAQACLELEDYAGMVELMDDAAAHMRVAYQVAEENGLLSEVRDGS